MIFILIFMGEAVCLSALQHPPEACMFLSLYPESCLASGVYLRAGYWVAVLLLFAHLFVGPAFMGVFRLALLTAVHFALQLQVSAFGFLPSLGVCPWMLDRYLSHVVQ